MLQQVVVEKRILEMEDALKNAGKSDTQHIKYLNDYVKTLNDYLQFISNKNLTQINEYLNNIIKFGDEGEVDASNFLMGYYKINREGTQLEINSKIALVYGKLKKADNNTNYKVPLSNEINEMGVHQVTQEQEVPEHSSGPGGISRDYNGTPMPTTDINDPNFFPSSGGDRDTDNGDILNKSLNNKDISRGGSLDEFLEKIADNRDEHNSDIEKKEYVGEADTYERNTIPENKSPNTIDNIGSTNNNSHTGENNMWINSKIAVDEEGRIITANPTTDIKGEECNDAIDNTITSEETNPIITKQDKVSFIMNGNTEKFSELESIISKIASDNSIDGIEEINIKLSKDNGDIEFKLAAEDMNSDIAGRSRQLALSFIENKNRINEEEFKKILDNKPRLKFEVFKWLKELNTEAANVFKNIFSSNEQQDNIGENKMAMWINSKLMLDEEGNLKEAEMKEAKQWNFEKDDDIEEDDVKSNRDKEKDNEMSKTKKIHKAELSSSEYSELESFISRIASEKGIEDVSEISINLSKEAGIIEFKIADWDYTMKDTDEDKESEGYSDDPDKEVVNEI
jgi:hypothetical protein